MKIKSTCINEIPCSIVQCIVLNIMEFYQIFEQIYDVERYTKIKTL